MTVFTKRAVDVFAPATAGGAARGADMGEAMVWGTEVERATDGASAGRVDQSTWAGLAAIAGTRAGQPAIVFGPDAGTHTDPVVGGTVANVGEYYWSASPAGWRRAGNLQRTLVHALNTGAGTANAVQATSDVQFSTAAYAALITVNFGPANTGAMTLAINGETPRPLVTNTGEAIPPGYVKPKMSALVQIDGDGNYRLFSYGDASAIQAAAEAAQTAAEAAALNAASYDPTFRFATVPLLVASTRSANGEGTIWQAGRYFYREASSSASDHDLTTAGSVKLYVDGDTMTPFAFGAIANGNGSGGGTNDAAALQKMLNAAGARNADVKLARGAVYRCDATLTVPAGVRIDGNGATLDLKNVGNTTGLSFADGGSIIKAKIIGAGNSTMNAAGKAIACSGVNNAPAAPTFVSAPDIRDCKISGWSGYGISLAYTNGGKISGNNVTNIGYTGIGGVSCNDTIVEANLVDGVGPGTVDAYGIFFDRNDGTSEVSDPRSYRVGIVNNVVKNVVSVPGNNGQGIDTHGGVDFRVIGNTVRDCEVGIFITSSAIAGAVKLAPKRCIVQGNTVSTSVYVGSGITVAGAFDGSTIQDFAEGCIVSGNTIIGHGIAGDLLSGGIYAIGTKNLVVKGNSIKNARCNGIFFNRSNIGLNVSGNTIVDPHDTTHLVPSCITVYANDNRGFIGGNTFQYEDPTLNTYVAIYSLWVASGLSGLDLEFGRSSFPGIVAGHLSYVQETSNGVNAADLMTQRGTVTIPLTDAASATVAVTTKRFPVGTPHVQLTRSGGPLPGTVTKSPLIEVSPTSLTATGFNVVARPYDGTTFGGSGNITVEWTATV